MASSPAAAASRAAASASASSSAAASLIGRRLYRSLLKAAKPFTPPAPNATTLTCLLHRTGYDDGELAWQSFLRARMRASADKQQQQQQQQQSEQQDDDEDTDVDEMIRRHHRSTSTTTTSTTTSASATSQHEDHEDDHRMLYSRLVREAIGGGGSPGRDDADADGDDAGRHRDRLGRRQMQFPHHVAEHPYQLRDIIRREFGGHRNQQQQQRRRQRQDDDNTSSGDSTTIDSNCVSASFSDAIRREVAFMALRELNTKLAYAESLLAKQQQQQQQEQQTSEDDDDEEEDASAESTTTTPTTASSSSTDDVVITPHPAQAARDVYPLLSSASTSITTTAPSSSPYNLQRGVYLLSHPSLPGYFRRSVICILEHRASDRQKAKASSSGNSDDSGDDDDDDDDDTSNTTTETTEDEAGKEHPASGTSSSYYGTYGLIVNKHALGLHAPPLGGGGGGGGGSRSSSSSSSSNYLRLDEVVRLPPGTGIREAFGSCLTREGGPVQPSLQMLHTVSPDEEVELGIGGTLLPMVQPQLDKDDDSGTENGDDVNDEEGAASASTALYSDRAVYYRGDIKCAADAVVEGQFDPDENVALFVGASCWAPGQLESEIERGSWIPVIGPPTIALTGTCEHVSPPVATGGDVDVDDNKGAAVQDTTTSKSKKKVKAKKTRPKADLWLSMLSACGEEEAKLAHLVYPDDGKDEAGDAADEDFY